MPDHCPGCQGHWRPETTGHTDDGSPIRPLALCPGVAVVEAVRAALDEMWPLRRMLGELFAGRMRKQSARFVLAYDRLREVIDGE